MKKANIALQQERKRLAIEAVKKACNNRKKAAKLLGIGRATLYRWLEL